MIYAPGRDLRVPCCLLKTLDYSYCFLFKFQAVSSVCRNEEDCWLGLLSFGCGFFVCRSLTYVCFQCYRRLCSALIEKLVWNSC